MEHSSQQSQVHNDDKVSYWNVLFTLLSFSAIDTATEMIDNKARNFTRGVIILLSNSYKYVQASWLTGTKLECAPCYIAPEIFSNYSLF